MSISPHPDCYAAATPSAPGLLVGDLAELDLPAHSIIEPFDVNGMHLDRRCSPDARQNARAAAS